MYYGIICLVFVHFCWRLSALGQTVLFKQLLNAFYRYLTLWRFEITAAISSIVANIDVKKHGSFIKTSYCSLTGYWCKMKRKYLGTQLQKTNQIVYLGSYKIYKIKNKNKRAFLHWSTLCFLCHNYLWQAISAMIFEIQLFLHII